MNREEVAARLARRRETGRAIVGVGAGTGISAKFAERAGVDLILVYNSGKYRMGGFSSNSGLLAIGDANQVVMDMGTREILPIVQDTPVIAGVNGTDPTRVMPRFLEDVERAGFSGVINFPSHGIIDGRWRQSLEETGFGYDREIAMIGTAHEQGLFTMSYCFAPDEARAMVDAGVDVVVAHMGLTVGGSIGAKSTAPGLDDAVVRIEEIVQASLSRRDDVLVFAHGGPLALPDDVAYVLARCGAAGFIGASSYERLAVEEPLADMARAFTEIEVRAR